MPMNDARDVHLLWNRTVNIKRMRAVYLKTSKGLNSSDRESARETAMPYEYISDTTYPAI
jgi:hypothetical protein